MRDVDKDIRSVVVTRSDANIRSLADPSPFSTTEEMDLAAELLTVSSEAELEQFLGDLIKKAKLKGGRGR